jgi:predicted nuclease with TOPRIM domain
VNRLRSSEAKLTAQAEAHKGEVEDLKKKIAETSENFEVAMAKHELSKIGMRQESKEQFHDSKERCYEMSLECAKNLKNSFVKVGAYSSEQKFIRGDPDGVI